MTSEDARAIINAINVVATVLMIVITIAPTGIMLVIFGTRNRK